MNTAIEASGLGKRYGRRWALAGCTLTVPAGRVAGLVGPNGAGKSTLLQLAAGLLDPDSGQISVLGGRPGGTAAQLARVGFVAQDGYLVLGIGIAGRPARRLGHLLQPAHHPGRPRPLQRASRASATPRPDPGRATTTSRASTSGRR